MTRFIRDYSLSLALAAMFLVAWLLQTLGGWQVYTSEQVSHGQVASAFGTDGYIWDWVEATFENWQSEFLQLFTFVALTVVLIHRESHESRDGQDRMAAQIEEILERLRRLDGEQPVGMSQAEREAMPALSRPRWVLGYFGGVLLVGLILNLVLMAALGG
jgi:hypothetical protein